MPGRAEPPADGERATDKLVERPPGRRRRSGRRRRRGRSRGDSPPRMTQREFRRGADSV